MSYAEKTGRLIVNADDLGMSPGANSAIFRCFDAGRISHASMMGNGDYFDEAEAGLKKRGIGKIGVHLNLTYGKALTASPSLQDRNGLLNNGFVSLFLKTVADRKISADIERELEAQIVKVKNSGFEITHLDSHRHVHMIPAVYSIVVGLARKYGIPRIRHINEKLTDSLKIGGITGFFRNGGLVKFLLLKTLSAYNGQRDETDKTLKFYSILFTGAVTEEAIEKIRGSMENYEIMVHPGVPEMDFPIEFHDKNEKAYRTSPQRAGELEALLNSSLASGDFQ